MSERASSNSPSIAWSAASGWRVTATATGLLRTCSRISVHVSIASDDRGGPLDRGGGAPAEDLEELPLLSDRLRVCGGALPGLVCPGRVTLGPLDPGSQEPRPALAEVVAVLFEDPECGGRDSVRLADRSSRFRVQPDELLLDART